MLLVTNRENVIKNELKQLEHVIVFCCLHKWPSSSHLSAGAAGESQPADPAPRRP